MDVIPDITPIVGYIDDVGVLCEAVTATATYIWDEHIARAEEQLSPNISDNSLNDAQATAPTFAQPSQQPVSSTARSRISGTA
ncbi:YkvA family protein [Pseudomonas asgharzadehiana]|uniref:YkvA family protein n=1 Tax=Pseudomonas asgharzadehiana TaxID=2842349 RepID=UPI0034D467A8